MSLTLILRLTFCEAAEIFGDGWQYACPVGWVMWPRRQEAVERKVSASILRIFRISRLAVAGSLQIGEKLFVERYEQVPMLQETAD